MYDQQGFYSDSGFAANAGAPNEGAGMGFSGFDSSDYFAQSQGGPRSARASRSAGPDTGGGFRDLFSQFFGRSAQADEAPTPERGTDLEYALNIDFWQEIRGRKSGKRCNADEQGEIKKRVHDFVGCGAVSDPSANAAPLRAGRPNQA